MPAAAASATELVPTGLPAVEAVNWGTHFCQLYRSPQELRDTLVPYFRTGLENDERCIWVTSDPVDADGARAMLADAVPDLAGREASGQIDFVEATDWYVRNASMNGSQVLQGWLEEEAEARRRGLSGLRISGNTEWLDGQKWGELIAYEPPTPPTSSTPTAFPVVSSTSTLSG
jgi:hypothetical protein